MDRYPPLAGDETATLLGSLERQRATFAWKCGGLDAEGLTKTVGVSAITIGGLLKHMAQVEDDYAYRRLRGERPGEPWDPYDWDWAWTSARDDSPEDVMALWRAAADRNRAAMAELLERGGDMGALSEPVPPGGERMSLRRLLVDLVEEYARHVGHADLIRETVDGLVGEDPPDLEA